MELKMPRKPRVSAAGVAEHVIQRGNNRQVVFLRESDKKCYVTWLKQYAQKYEVQIHAWVLMTNHVHILCTPSSETGISQMMQSLGRMYVRYFNKSHKRTGTLWEGRYRSCVVQEEGYLMQVYRYIELNPVRAGLVKHPAEFSWSSYQCNGLGKTSDLLTPHPLYLSLGKNDFTRLDSYRAFIEQHFDSRLLEDIRRATNKGLALGNESFIAAIERRTGKSLTEAKRGRKVGLRKNRENDVVSLKRL